MNKWTLNIIFFCATLIIYSLGFSEATNMYTNNTFLPAERQSHIVNNIIRPKLGDDQASQADKAFNTWKNLISANTGKSEMDKVLAINHTLNDQNAPGADSSAIAEFISDQAAWNKSDDWESPLEFVGYRNGDCEDFSFAKYFTLRALGVPDNQLYIVYTRFTPNSGNPLTMGIPAQGHMVLIYIPREQLKNTIKDPLILDSLDPALKPASARPDLKASHIFNAEKLMEIRLNRFAKEKDRSSITNMATFDKLQNKTDFRIRPAPKKNITIE